MTGDHLATDQRPAPTQPPEREIPCPRNPRVFLLATNAPWGRVRAYCRSCKITHTVMLGKVPSAA